MEVYRSDGNFAMLAGSPEQYYQTESQIQLASTSSADVLREQSYASLTLCRASKGNTGGPAPLQAENEADEKKRTSFREAVWASAGESRLAHRRLSTRPWIKKMERDEKAVRICARFKEMVQAKAMPPG